MVYGGYFYSFSYNFFGLGLNYQYSTELYGIQRIAARKGSRWGRHFVSLNPESKIPHHIIKVYLVPNLLEIIQGNGYFYSD